MLRARTEEQKKKVLEIFGIQETCCHFPLDFDKETDWGYEEFDDRIYLDGDITFDKMREVVEYLRNENEDVEYARTDVFIKKACDWIKYNNENGGCLFDGWEEDFKKYIRGE